MSSAMMDMYFNSTSSDSILTEMLDIDIKTEIDTLMGGHNDLSGFNFADLPPLELDDSPDVRWFSSNSNLSNSSFNLDFSAEDAITQMVNPNVVMPVNNMRSPSPSLKESHLTFSPSNLKPTNNTANSINAANSIAVKKDLIASLDNVNGLLRHSVVNHQQERKHTPILAKQQSQTFTKVVTPILAKTIVKNVAKTTPTLLSFRNAVQRQLTSPVTVSQVSNITSIRAFTNPNANQRKQQFNHTRIKFESDQQHNITIKQSPTISNQQFNQQLNPQTIHRPYPKPAYSYSCLIAMALKNSKSGSLPVSEIYNFMCKHFPYFKSAPNGWKNSVRHNLSLNKCFEKIEKPALNGAQRKGCLWAMNPSKISKMDEEVQKWSKKDPGAIRRAMVFPETLESLERGELKFSCSYDEMETFGDSCGSAESEEGSESEPEVEQETETDVDHPYSTTQQFINISGIKVEDEDPDFDVEVASMYDDEQDIEDDEDILRMEMALAEKELLEYEGRVTVATTNATSGARRRKTYYIHQ